MKKLLLPVLLIAFIFGSCQKHNQKIQSASNYSNSKEPAHAMLGSGGINPENPNNPIDSIGYYHNLLVSYFFQKGYNSTTPRDSLNSWIEYFVEQHFNINNFDAIVQNDTFQNALNESYNAFTIDTLINGINQDLASGQISQEAHNDMLQVISAVDSLKFQSTLTAIAIQGKIDEVKAIENSVINSGMRSSDKQYVLVQTSICRHSLAYWYNLSYGVQSNANSFSPQASQSLTSAEVSAIAFADCRGAQMAISTGAVRWATVFGGPEAGVAVMVAYAGVFSYNAYEVIVNH